MKKNLLIALLMAIVAIPASAQLKWGVEAGLNLNKLTHHMEDHKVGFFVGPKAQFSFLGFIVDGAVEYSQCQYFDDTQSFFIVPVNFKYSIGLGSIASVYLGTGPQWNWHVGGNKAVKDNQLSWNVGAGVHLMKHFQIGVNYNIGCTDAAYDLKNNMWQARVAYMF